MTDDAGGTRITWTAIVMTTALLLTAASGAWVLFQSQFANMEKQSTAANQNVDRRIDENTENIDAIRHAAISREEHVEFVKRLDHEIGTINDRIRIIEQTRPTTGELASIVQSNKEQQQEVKERVRSLEDNLRRATPPFQPGATK